MFQLAATAPFGISGELPRKVEHAECRKLPDFGGIGNNRTGDSETLDKALAFFSSDGNPHQGTLILPPGAIYLSRPLKVSSGLKIAGQGPNFGTQLVPLKDFEGKAVIEIGGSEQKQGWIFRVLLEGFCVNFNLTDRIEFAIRAQKTYAVGLKEILLHKVAKIGVAIANSNHVIVSELQIGGSSESADSTGVAAQDVINLCIGTSDIEGFGTAIRVRGRSVVSITHVYVERCGTAFDVYDEPKVNVFGGVVRISRPRSAAVQIHSSSAQIRSFGLVVESPDTVSHVKSLTDLQPEAERRLREEIIWLRS